MTASNSPSSTDSVPFGIEDLPGWAARVYDHNLQHPELSRLIASTRLEQHPDGRWFNSSRHEHKLRAIATAQAAGRLRPADPADLLILLISMASAWSPSSSVYTATTQERGSDHDRRRVLLREAVVRVTQP
ncbi:hypothetical protein [Microbacterium sp. LWS13-1.2]|uniref:HTH-type transcriptional repressor Sco4008 C-terminal domain-containing protein n=1 Tax=Microbacterium sp. LWS13-1.2 TaxID=3135264 RepID=A0AAU6S8P6_9MICO